MKPKRITLGIVLEHMQAMERRIVEYMNDRFERVDKRFERVENRLNGLERKTDLISIQIDNIDHRLDVVEIEDLPKRVRKLEKRFTS